MNPTTARRSSRVAGAACLVAALVVGVWPGPAGAEAPEVTGYWNRLKPQTPPQLGNPIPPPPDVEQGELLVANDPSGAQVVSALRFLASDPVTATLTLTSESALASASVLACPITSTWDQATDGAWANRPTTDCSGGGAADGTVNEAGDAMTWEIGPQFFREGVLVSNIEIGLVPEGPVPFRVVFDKPDRQTLVADRPLYTVPSDPPAPPPALPSGGFTSPPATSSFGGPGPGGDPFDPSPAPLPGDEGSDPAGEGAADQPTENVALDLPAPDSTADRVLAVVLLAVIGGGLVLAGAGSPREPRLIGGTAGRGALHAQQAPPDDPGEERGEVGGVGRFRRARSRVPAG